MVQKAGVLYIPSVRFIVLKCTSLLGSRQNIPLTIYILAYSMAYGNIILILAFYVTIK